MERISAEEFKKRYGEVGLEKFVNPAQPKSSLFNLQAAKDVFTKAGRDVQLAQQNQIEKDNSLSSTLKTGATAALQGGLSIPRAIDAGIMGTEKGEELTGNVIDTMTKLGEAITPDSIQNYIGDKATQVIEGYNAMSPQEQLNQRNKLAVAEVLSYFLGGEAAKTATTPVVRGTEQVLKTGKEGAEQGLKATQEIIPKVTDVAASAADIAKGFGTQLKEFGKRVATGAQETAEQSRKLATLPEPEAKLIRTGVDDAAVKLIKESTPTEKTIYKNLVEKAKVRSGDLLAEQPKVVIGQEFMKPVSHLITVRNSVGSKLGAVRQKLSNAPVDVTPQWRQFRAYLDGRGITVNKSGKFTGSGNMAKSDLAELQKMYDEIRPDKSGKVMRSQKWLDEWSQRTFKEYDLRQAREQTFSDDVTRTVEKARTIFKQALPKEYRALSTQYSEAMKPLQEVVKLLGFKGDIEKLTTKQLKAAEVALRIIGNAADRPQSVIDDLLKAATKFGFKSDTDLKKLIIFADALEDIYPNITPKRGLTGSVARGVNQTGVGLAGDIATGNIKGVLGQALNSTASQKEIQEALDAFLKSL